MRYIETNSTGGDDKKQIQEGGRSQDIKTGGIESGGEKEEENVQRDGGKKKGVKKDTWSRR